MTETKSCTRCGVDRPVFDFPRVGRHDDRRRAVCTPCASRATRERRRANRAETLAVRRVNPTVTRATCGTMKGWRQHRNNAERSCPDCDRAYNTAANREWRRRRRADLVRFVPADEVLLDRLAAACETTGTGLRFPDVVDLMADYNERHVRRVLDRTQDRGFVERRPDGTYWTDRHAAYTFMTHRQTERQPECSS